MVWLLWFWLWAALPLLSVARPLLLVERVTVRPSPGLAAVSGKYRRAAVPLSPLAGVALLNLAKICVWLGGGLRVGCA